MYFFARAVPAAAVMAAVFLTPGLAAESDDRAWLVKDVDDTFVRTANSDPFDVVEIRGVAFFTADDGVNGRELWRTDGTEAGTFLVKDIRLGPAGSNPFGLIDANGTLFFVADDGLAGQEVWKSDGTPQGTILVKDIVPGPGSSFRAPNRLMRDAVLNGLLFFAAFQPSTGTELWKTDGTESGTVLV